MTGTPAGWPMTVISVCVVGVVVAAMVTPAAVVASPQPQQPETDNTVTRVHVAPNGSAQWTIRIRTRLDTDERVSEYEAFQARFRENTSRYLSPFRNRIRGVVANAANATGREMRAVNVTASTSIQEVPRRWGVVTYRFTWTQFANERNGSLSVGDVFQNGFFLAANDTLKIEVPPAYDIVRVEPTPASREGGVVTWVGHEDFASRHPHVVFTPAQTGDPTTGAQQTGTGAATADGATGALFSDVGPGVVLGLVLLFGLVGIGAYGLRNRRDEPGGTDRPAATGPNTEAGAEGAEEREPTGQKAPSGETATASGVMTDTERVLTLLEANDGRMRQATIADEFDWSASKVSRTIGKMVDDGRVKKLQLGRENLIDLADSDE